MGAGINLFKQLFPEDYYAYQTATLISSKPVSKVIKDSNDQTIATYPLGGDELRGILKVVDGQLVAYGDVKPSDGNGTKVFEIVDLGSLEWSLYGDRWGSNAILDMKFVPNNDTLSGYLCDKYTEYTANSLANGSMIGFAINTIGNIAIRTGDTLNTPIGKVIYEKATPTAKSYTPFTNPMLCGSTEEFTDSRTLKMFCGHDSLYYSSPFKGW